MKGNRKMKKQLKLCGLLGIMTISCMSSQGMNAKAALEKLSAGMAELKGPVSRGIAEPQDIKRIRTAFGGVDWEKGLREVDQLLSELDLLKRENRSLKEELEQIKQKKKSEIESTIAAIEKLLAANNSK
jgi:predicted  nucleic acid-binding Zn-ribbon protein